MHAMDSTESLYYFLEEQFAASGYTLDSQVFQLLEMHLTLAAVPKSEAEETRSVELKQGSDGKVSGKMFSLFNVKYISLNDLFGVTLKATSILTIPYETRIKAALAFLTVVYDFNKHLSRVLNETEAKILLAIYELSGESISLQAVADKCKTLYASEAIPYKRVAAVLSSFVEMKILGKGQTEGDYIKKQTISLTRS